MPRIAVNARAMMEGSLPVLVSIAVPAASVLAGQDIKPPFAASVLDRDGVLVARSLDHDRWIGTRAGDDLLGIVSGGRGHFVARNFEGVETLAGYARTRLGQWTVLAMVPEDVAQAGARTMLTTLSVLGLGLAALSAALAAWFGRRAAAAIRRVRRMARLVGQGETPDPVATPVREANELGEALAVAARDLRDRQAELGRSERGLRDVLDNLIALVAVLEPDGTLVEINRAPLRATGRAREDVVGRKLWEVFPWSGEARARDALRRAVHEAAAGAAPRIDLDAPRAGGSRIVLDLQVSPLRDSSGRHRPARRLGARHHRARARERPPCALKRGAAFPASLMQAGRLGSWDVDLSTGRWPSSPSAPPRSSALPPWGRSRSMPIGCSFILPEDRAARGRKRARDREPQPARPITPCSGWCGPPARSASSPRAR